VHEIWHVRKAWDLEPRKLKKLSGGVIYPGEGAPDPEKILGSQNAIF